MKLDKWQQDVLNTKGNILLATGRQVGKTTILAIKAAERMVEKKTSILIASLTEDQAELIIGKILEHLMKHHASSIKQGKDRPTKHIIRLKNGSMAQSRAVGNTGNSIRGFTADVFIPDEASRLPNDLWAAAEPTLLTTGGEIWLASTPFGRSGYFWECFKNIHGFYTIFKISSEEAVKNREVSDTWTEKIREAALALLNRKKVEMSKVLYEQEFGGEFVEDLMQFFPDELIQKCMKLQRPLFPNINGSYFIGVDVGGKGTGETAIEVIDRTDRNLLKQVENITKMDFLTTETAREIINQDAKYNSRRIYVDDGGMGYGVFSQLLETPQTKRKVIPINNSSRPLDKDETRKKKILKEDLYNNLLCLMENGKILLLDDPNIYQSLRSVQFEFDQETKQLKIFGTYTHITEGLIRAAWCSKDKSLKPFIY